MINDCFKKRYFPTQYKKIELSLVYKGKDKEAQNAKSYRPIKYQGKIIEKAIHTCLNQYLVELQKPHPKQYDYRKRKLTVDVIWHKP